MSLEDIFGRPQADLIEAFLICEAWDYSETKWGGEQPDTKQRHIDKWVSNLISKIEDELRRCRTIGANRYHICSYGNTGCKTRELILDGVGDWFNWREKDIFIDLCTCGDVNHWGFISRG